MTTEKQKTIIRIGDKSIDLSQYDENEIEIKLGEPETTHTYNLSITVKIGSESDKQLEKMVKYDR